MHLCHGSNLSCLVSCSSVLLALSNLPKSAALPLVFSVFFVAGFTLVVALGRTLLGDL